MTPRPRPHLRAATLPVAGCLLGLLAGSASAAERQAIVVPPGQARFQPMDPARPAGPEIAVLWGDPATGPSALFLKLKKGGGRLHYHTSDYHLVLLEGTMKHWAAEQTEEDVAPLGPGSYWFQPGGQAHGDACLTDECLVFLKYPTRRDSILVEQEPK